MGTTACPCGCKRDLPVAQRTVVQIAFDESTPLSELALVNALPVWAVRHIQLTLSRLSASPSFAG
ncbi:MAG: hypothetical protein QOI95_2333 [Acidimicrobiaceae bacterium]|jgi:hypothetical protein